MIYFQKSSVVGIIQNTHRKALQIGAHMHCYYGIYDLAIVKMSAQPGRATDTAGAVRGLGAIYPANALRPADNPATRNLQRLLTAQRS